MTERKTMMVRYRVSMLFFVIRFWFMKKQNFPAIIYSVDAHERYLHLLVFRMIIKIAGDDNEAHAALNYTRSEVHLNIWSKIKKKSTCIVRERFRVYSGFLTESFHFCIIKDNVFVEHD